MLKVEVKGKDKDFPKLMQHIDKGYIVLFSGNEKGVTLSTSCTLYPIGYSSSNWGMGSFKDFEGSVTISS